MRATAKLLALTTALTALAGPVLAQNPLGAPPPLEAFGQLPEVTQVDLSPDGKHAAMVVLRDGKRYLVDLDLATEQTVAQPLGDLKVRDIFWVGNRHVALVKSRPDFGYSIFKQELSSVNLQEMATGKSRLLFDGLATDFIDPIVSGDIHVFHDDKDYRVTASTLQRKGVDGGRYLLYAFGANDKSTRQIDDAPTDVVEWVLSPDGKPYARSRYDFERSRWKLEFRDGRDWSERFVLETPASDIPDLLGLGPDGQSILTWSDAAGYQAIAPDGSFTAIKPEGNGLSTAQFHPVTRKFNGFAITEDWTTYSFLDEQMKALPALAAKALPGYRLRFVDFGENTRQVVVYGESIQDSGSYYFIDFDTGAATIIGSQYPEVPEAWIPPKHIVKYKAADGLEIEAFLTLPPGRAPKGLPLIVLPHGGPESRDSLGFEWDVAAYASRGYAVLQPNFRGSEGYGKDFTAKGYGEFGKKMQTDLSDGVRFLAAQGVVDAGRVCIVGYSYGGYAAMAGAAFDKGVYRCAASYSGVMDLPAFTQYITSKTYSGRSAASLYWKQFFGSDEQGRAVSPVTGAGNIDIPVLLIHGRDDTVVPFSQSVALRDALVKAGKPVQFVELKGEDHHLSRADTRLRMLTEIVNFVEKNNPAW